MESVLESSSNEQFSDEIVLWYGFYTLLLSVVKSCCVVRTVIRMG